jgi:hypothetical protein
MAEEKAALFTPLPVRGCLLVIGILTVLLCSPIYAGASFGYTESKGPFKNWTQVADLEGDGDLDVIASHTRWEDVDLSWAGVGRWINRGDGTFELLHQEGIDALGGYAAGAGDVNGDRCLDALVGTNTGATLWINQCHETQDGGPIFVQAGQLFEARQTVKEKLQAGFSAAADALYGLYFPYGSIRTKAVFLADMDGDGDLDALLARAWWAEIWWNEGQGEFRRSEERFEYREDTGVAVADFDGDGDQDIFTGRNHDDYQVWWNDGSGVYKSGN